MVELPELEPKYSPTPLPSKEYMRSGAAAGPGVNTCDFPAGAELATLQKCRRVPLGTDMPGISCLRSPAAKRPNTGHIRQSILSKKTSVLGLNMKETIEREDMNVRAGEVFWRVK